MPTDPLLAQALLEAMTEAMYVVDRDRSITYWNPAAERLTGYPAAEVVGRRCRDGILNHVDDAGTSLCGARCPLLGTMGDGQLRECFAYLHHREGHRVPVALRAAPLRNGNGKVTGAVEVFHDDSRYRTLAEQVDHAEHRALTDPLTGLGNRRMLQESLWRHEDELGRYGRCHAVLFADIDNFKGVNDTFGHRVGDQVLQLVAATLRDCTRPSDVVGRWGGEEFLVIAPATGEREAVALADRMRNLVDSSWLDVRGSRLGVTLSIGVAVADQGLGAAVVDRADEAMYRSKTEGKNRTTVG